MNSDHIFVPISWVSDKEVLTSLDFHCTCKMIDHQTNISSLGLGTCAGGYPVRLSLIKTQITAAHMFNTQIQGQGLSFYFSCWVFWHHQDDSGGKIQWTFSSISLWGILLFSISEKYFIFFSQPCHLMLVGNTCSHDCFIKVKMY